MAELEAGLRLAAALDLFPVPTASVSESESETFPTTCLLFRILALDERVSLRAARNKDYQSEIQDCHHTGILPDWPDQNLQFLSKLSFIF